MVGVGIGWGFGGGGAVIGVGRRLLRPARVGWGGPGVAPKPLRPYRRFPRCRVEVTVAAAAAAAAKAAIV